MALSTMTAEDPAARSAFVADRMPPSMSATRRSSPADRRQERRNSPQPHGPVGRQSHRPRQPVSPDSASTAVTRNRRCGQRPVAGSKEAIRAIWAAHRRPPRDSGPHPAARLRRIQPLVEQGCRALRMTSRLTAGTAAAPAPWEAGGIAASACRSVPNATCEPTIDPAEVPTIASADDRSTPARRRPMTIPASQATPALPPPPSTTPPSHTPSLP